MYDVFILYVKFDNCNNNTTIYIFIHPETDGPVPAQPAIKLI